MAGELRSILTGLVMKPTDTAYRPKTVDMKSAGLAALATVGTGMTPRKFVKTLHQVAKVLEKHKATLGPELLKALQASVCSAASASSYSVHGGFLPLHAHSHVRLHCILHAGLERSVD